MYKKSFEDLPPQVKKNMSACPKPPPLRFTRSAPLKNEKKVQLGKYVFYIPGEFIKDYESPNMLQFISADRTLRLICIITPPQYPFFSTYEESRTIKKIMRKLYGEKGRKAFINEIYYSKKNDDVFYLRYRVIPNLGAYGYIKQIFTDGGDGYIHFCSMGSGIKAISAVIYSNYSRDLTIQLFAQTQPASKKWPGEIIVKRILATLSRKTD